MTRQTHPLTFIDPVCGKPWIHVKSIPAPMDPLDPARFEHLDGSEVEPWEPLMCESCGRMGGNEVLPYMTIAENYVERTD